MMTLMAMMTTATDYYKSLFHIVSIFPIFRRHQRSPRAQLHPSCSVTSESNFNASLLLPSNPPLGIVDTPSLADIHPARDKHGVTRLPATLETDPYLYAAVLAIYNPLLNSHKSHLTNFRNVDPTPTQIEHVMKLAWLQKPNARDSEKGVVRDAGSIKTLCRGRGGSRSGSALRRCGGR
ncbi:hypothetical protein VC83_02176 [Pseudogymnoascus destructans]|uniref:Uncharacterized protein n=1 Tax=Pseudogymnoascus destructans TaxID=655981 RepID=A0A177AJS4_9PEZI|nr:uncharacterized protein VC83_02176 [Pseudogymnoascus destructans]OAF61543.1 hypothetical protein VC83_02176 [Pseudogymnoascus destructans]